MIYLLLFTGLILRIISLNQSLWLDEATSALVAKMPLAEIFAKFLPGDFHPPFYYVFLHFWVRIFGSSEVSLRIPSIIFGIVTVYLIYLIGKTVANKKTGIIAAGLLATSGLHIYYSQEARMYSLAAFLVTLLVFSFVKIVKSGGVGNWLLFSLTLALVFLTDYIAILILPVFWIHGFIKKQKIFWWKNFFASHIILVLSCAIWAPTFIKQFQNGLLVSVSSPSWWQILGQTSFKNLALIPTKFMIGRISFDNKPLYALIVSLVGLVFGYLIYKGRKISNIILLWLILPIGLGALVSFKIPTLSYFRFIFCLPAFYLSVAFGVQTLGKYKKLALLVIVTVNLLTSAYYLVNSRFHRENWRAAAVAIGDEKVIFPADSQKEALVYYRKGSQIVDSSQLNKSDKEIWLSRYVWEIFDPADSARKNVESLGYNKIAEYSFNGVVFWQYAHSN